MGSNATVSDKLDRNRIYSAGVIKDDICNGLASILVWCVKQVKRTKNKTEDATTRKRTSPP